MTKFTFFLLRVMQIFFKSSFYHLYTIYAIYVGSDFFSDLKEIDITNYRIS
ncbi:hypothetical protein ATE84_3927 [Aquimarina sp. MAR_2010_214]|nr:hypothetical protein ATE84_3927 [Aquimarina sp. MAR_2010_214]